MTSVAACGALSGCHRIPWHLPDPGTPTDTPETTRETTTTTRTTTRQSTTATPTETTTTTGSPTTTTTEGTPGIINGSFEKGLEAWTIGRDLPEDPNNPGNPVESAVETAPRPADQGQRTLALFIDGSQDDGTVWVQQQVDLTGVEAVTVDAFSPRLSFNTITKLAVYAGPERDLAEEQFDTRRALNGHEGWKSFTYPVDHDGVGLVAVGISVVWETEVTRLLDDVRITATE